MGTRVIIDGTEFELPFDVPPGTPLPPGVEWLEDEVEEESWPDGVPRELVAYAREVALSPDQVSHWIAFFTQHPEGQRIWEEARNLWKSPRPRKKR
ncbi:MAG: hypothetical protein ACP5SI_01420 [Chloroflexia bacterium]